MTADDSRFDPEQPERYELRLAVGEESAPDGRTELALSGSGSLRARQVLRAPAGGEKGRPERQEPTAGGAGGEKREARGEMPAAEAAELLDKASRFDWRADFPKRKGIPDEPTLVWRLGPRDGDLDSVRVWLRDAEDDPTMAPVLEALREGVARISNGEIYL